MLDREPRDFLYKVDRRGLGFWGFGLRITKAELSDQCGLTKLLRILQLGSTSDPLAVFLVIVPVIHTIVVSPLLLEQFARLEHTDEGVVAVEQCALGHLVTIFSQPQCHLVNLGLQTMFPVRVCASIKGAAYA